jgi:glutamate synthase (NADPH/NADH) small chain
MEMAPLADTAFTLEADLVLLAMGFVGPSEPKQLATLGVALDPRGAIATNAAHHTNLEGVFAAGDVRRGASLIVWAIREGRDAAAAMHAYLDGRPLTRPAL